VSIFTGLRQWWNNQDTIDSLIFAQQEMGRILDFVRQDKEKAAFLLENGALVDAPSELYRAMHAITPYAYIHPKTLAKLVGGCTTYPTHPWIFLSPSPTRWVSTDLMPEGRVIYSPNAMPGLPGGNYVQKVFAGKR
jgi:hypothetical protein